MAALTPITNAGITREENWFFLDGIRAARPGASPRETTVLWDEYFHGYRGSLWDYCEDSVPGRCINWLLRAIFIVLAFSGGAARFILLPSSLGFRL